MVQGRARLIRLGVGVLSPMHRGVEASITAIVAVPHDQHTQIVEPIKDASATLTLMSVLMWGGERSPDRINGSQMIRMGVAMEGL